MQTEPDMLKNILAAAFLIVAVAQPVAPAEAGILKKVAKAVVLKTVVPVACLARKIQHKSTGKLCN
jgi:hypothetical protein